MFENLIGQHRLKELLTGSLKSRTLPPAMLFFGPVYSGKLTAALELARGLSCQKEGAWGCVCSACQAQLRLMHPYTVMLGSRYFPAEIARSAEALAAVKSEASQYLFLRSVRKLLRRFDSFLWEDDDKNFKKAKPLIAPVEELLEEFEPGKPFPKASETAKKLSEIQAKSAEIAQILHEYAISIGQIRALSQWARTSSQQTKTVILEEADRMQEGARNALLKILEEPPQRLRFILISRSRSSIMPTILSRVRPYAFLPRSAEEEARALGAIFKDSSSSGLGEFFSGVSGRELKEAAVLFYRNRQASRPFFESYKTAVAERDFKRFLEELSCCIRTAFNQSLLTARQAASELSALNAIKRQYEIFNQRPQNLCERFFYAKQIDGYAIK